jgi:PAS domain S-box-containing protein
MSWLIAGSIVPLLIVGWIDLTATSARILATQAELLTARGDQIAGEVDQFNRGYLQAAQRLAGVAEVAGFFASGDGRSRLRPGLASRLLAHVTGDAAVRGIGIIDPQGDVMVASAPGASPPSVARRGYFRDARARGAVVSSVYIDAAAEDQPTIAYLAPVYGADRAVIGHVAFWVRAEALWALARRANGRAGRGSFAVMLDELGIRIAHTYHHDIVFHPAGALSPEVVETLVGEQRFGARTRALVTDVRRFPEQFERARARAPEPGMFRGFAPVNQQYNYGVSHRLATAPWTVFYMVPEATLTAPLAAARWQKLIFALVVLAAATVLGLGFARQIITPLRGLGAAANRLAAGDASSRATLVREDEIGDLAASFNAMADEVASSRQRLESLVAARTADLRRANDSLKAEIAWRTEAQLALAASEGKYRDLYENSPDMYMTADLITDRIVDCNQTLCERLGYEKSELIGQSAGLVYHESYRADDRAAAIARFQQVGEFLDVERTLRRRDGGSIEVSLNVRAIRDGQGHVVAARAIWRDISARKEAERDRLLLMRLGEVLRSSANEAVLMHAVSVEIAQHLRVSRCSFADIDYPAGRMMIHRDVHGAFPSAAGDHTLEAFGAAIEETHRGQTVVVHDAAADPRTADRYETGYLALGIRAFVVVPLLRNAEWKASVFIADPDVRRWQDREIHLLGLVAERVWVWIEHLRVLAALRHQSVRDAVARPEARFRVFVEAIQDYAVIMLDPSGVIATWNIGAERIKGYTADEIIGRTLDVFYTPEDIASGHAQAVLERARADGRYEEEGWRLRKDGARFWASIVVSTVRDPDGRIAGFAKVTRDITERRLKDEELRSRQAQLTQHLKERDVLLQEIHHRVKNNLQVISSLINMQVQRLEPGASRAALEECQTRVFAIALIHEKLYQSKDYSQIQFADYARNLAASVFQALGVSGSDITLDLAIDPVPLTIDRAIPCGLLINELITNALKHAFAGGRSGTIRVGLTRIEDKLRLEVRDNGVGLPPSWDAYKMESMGLQLVTTLAEQLDGVLTVEGRGGAAFQITFPASS